MPSFKMPEFYMPYPARLNPNLENSRVHVKSWAHDVGIIDGPAGAPGAGVWNENKLDSMDFALFAALTYPDASAPELDLLSDWYLWAWFLDDFLLDVITYRSNLAGARESISQLVEFACADGVVTPVPSNPLETGLTDLWVRTIASVSADWRARFSGVVQAHIKNTLLEFFNADQGWVPNPIDHLINVRRKGGGMEFAAYLVEHSLGIEIPSDIASTRPLRVLKDTYADVAALRNDIFSYEKEVLAGELNGVMIIQEFLDCDLQRAIDVTNDLTTSRMQQFENSALAELPLLFEDKHLDLKERLDILRYVKGLQDYMAGDFQWTKETGRYKEAEKDIEKDVAEAADEVRAESSARWSGVPNGLGTAATRITQTASRAELDPAVTSSSPATDYPDEHEETYRLLAPDGLGTVAARLGLARRLATVAWPTTSPMVGDQSASRVELPDFYMPFQARCNPRLSSARPGNKEWASEMGFLGSGLPGWDEPGFDSADHTRLAALLHPDAPASEFDLIAEGFTWGLFLADFFDENFLRRRDLAGGKLFVERLPEFMPILQPEAVGDPVNLVEKGLADLWPRIASTMSTDWRRWFSATIQEICGSFLWETFNLIQNRIPDPVDYVEMRRWTSGAEIAELMIHYQMGLRMPAEIHDARIMRTMIEAFLDWHGLLNDIFSYQREIEQESEIHNGVLIIQRFLGCDLRQAVALTNDLVSSQLRHFEHVAAVKLPTLLDEAGSDSACREEIDRYFRALQDCVAGLFEGHMVSVRYELTTRPQATSDVVAADGISSTRMRPPSMRPPLSGPAGLGTTAARPGSAHGTAVATTEPSAVPKTSAPSSVRGFQERPHRRLGFPLRQAETGRKGAEL